MSIDIRDYTGSGQGMDLSDTVVHVCPCGSRMFRTVVSFDNYEIAAYCLDGECLECGTRVKLPCLVDKEDYEV